MLNLPVLPVSAAVMTSEGDTFITLCFQPDKHVSEAELPVLLGYWLTEFLRELSSHGYAYVGDTDRE